MLISPCIPLFLDTFPLLAFSTFDPEEEQELGELSMKLPRMKGE